MDDDFDTRSGAFDLACGIDRSAAVRRVLHLLAGVTRHVHLHGPPGYGKGDAIAGLREACFDRTVVVRLQEIELGQDDPLKRIAEELSGKFASGWPVDDWEAAWICIADAARRRFAGRPLLILEAPELLFDVHDPKPWPSRALDVFDLVTVSIAPLHLFFTPLSEEEARKISVPLQAFPAPEEDDNDYAYASTSQDRWNAQPREDYVDEGKTWFEKFLIWHPDGAKIKDKLDRVFRAKHERRRDDIWDGHPLLNFAVLERMLDTVLAGGDPRSTLDRFKADLGSLRGTPSALRDRLLPFLSESAGTVSPRLALGVADAVTRLASAGVLDARTQEWALCSGLVRPAPEGGSGTWTSVATLLARNPDTDQGREEIRRWGERLAMAARERMRRLEDAKHQSDRKFQSALDQVRMVFCETDSGYRLGRRIEFGGRTRPIISGHMYSVELSHRSETPVAKAKTAPRRKERTDVLLLVFETGAEGTRFWRHQVRVLAMLGRMRHPALPAFGRGGMLRTEGTVGHPERAYIEIENLGHRLRSGNLDEVLHTLQTPRDSTSPIPAFEQIASLAEALDLVHAQGLLHRSLDFDALALSGEGDRTQLVITGFEYSINLRSLLAQRAGASAVIWRSAPWNLACRAPEAINIGDTVIDPSVDVYALGALATMLMTGLPTQDVLSKVDRLLPVSLEQNTPHDALVESNAWTSAAKLLRQELLRLDRWQSGDDSIESLGRLLATCLDENPAKRPAMEDLAPRLRQLFREYSGSFVRAGEILHVSFSEREMGHMLKQLDLIDEDQDVESAEGRAWLRSKIQEWLLECRWMHYREQGFPKQGGEEAERLRRNSKYIFAGPAVVFFAAPYERPATRQPTWDTLWLSYALHRYDIHLPDPDDRETEQYRTTTEHVTWIPRPRNIEIVAQDKVPYLQNIASWEGVRRELEAVGKLDNQRVLGREASTVWRVHRDIQLALEAIKSFPVKLQPEHGGESSNYVMELDEDGFRRLNERGQFSFFRQVILEGRNARAFYADTVAAMAEEAQGGRLGFRIFPRGVGNKRRHRLAASVMLPVTGERIRVRLDEGESDQVPRNARIVWFDSIGSRVAADRQSEATTRLERKSWLMQYLVRPRDCGTLLPPITDGCGKVLDASEERIHQLRERVRLMLGSDPLHAVQGPPGTGKTTLVSALADEVVRSDDGARMLVTSQSHAATDNVVLAVMSALSNAARREGREDGSMVAAIRLFSDQTEESVDPEVRRRYSIDAQVREAQRRMREYCEKQIAVPETPLAKALERLKRASTHGYLEIRSKIERSAPLVFSTTGAAMTAGQYLRRGVLAYDYALIDEAAKAWAIDLIQPMALADRAILVGDQAQLPPFGEIEMGRILTNALRRRGELFSVPPDIDFLLDTSRTREGEESPFERMQGWLKLFHRLFEKRQSSNDSIPLTQSLNRQFRSVAAIGKVVSDTFYHGSVGSDGPDPDPDRRISIPLGLDGGTFAPAVVWIDTSGLADARFFTRVAGAGMMRNEGELAIVKRLLHRFRPESTPEDPWERLRVLSPYKAQVQNLMSLYYAQPHALGVTAAQLPRLFQTVDASQGSEADIVVISICRRFPIQQFSTPTGGDSEEMRREALRRRINEVLGFLQQPERLNVMMSRARQQLILVGDFEYFKAGAELMSAHRAIDASASNEADTPVFWKKLQSAFAPFDRSVHVTATGLERPIILPGRMVLEAGQ